MKIISRYCQNSKISVLLIPVLLFISACTGIGPPTVARDRFDYVNAMSESWKRQILLNLVKIRYMDAPVFLDVASVINQYSLEGEIALGASWSDAITGDRQTIGGTGRYSDRPTITYTPLSGARFTQQLMTPIPVAAILSLLQSGYPADFVFRIGVQTINGVNNRFGGQLMQRTADPAFYDLLRALNTIQQSDGLGMRVKPKDGKSAIVMFFRTPAGTELSQELAIVQRILRVSLLDGELEVAFGSMPQNDRELAIQTRSMLQIIVELASHIDVPSKDVAEGRVYATPATLAPGFPDLINIHSGTTRPTDAYAAVRYRDMWFWIDDRDLNSKRMFAFTMLLFSLTETGGDQRAPIVTVPTN
ncbi:hypothetical protein [Desulfosarcina sp.]|uniref:hypothetical protein n=1 Tax=Desulfosarcina sp. TaxID=2027861 RepID=UPI0029A9556B|nr:hypothetical protein [Desulfosarcina sp.]MDX2454324.1 hypothetical protein [Desulfosarcina sp.]MDX2491992.1 hypothetical protein [Desulfosarcina sp.]